VASVPPAEPISTTPYRHPHISPLDFVPRFCSSSSSLLIVDWITSGHYGRGEKWDFELLLTAFF
ncbi:unnamed protein product, partial [Coffea canephora]